MSDAIVTIRLSRKERENLEKLSKNASISISGYIKQKLFDDNPEHANSDTKFITPDKATNDYFLAYNISRIFFYIQKVYENQSEQSQEDLEELKQQVAQMSRDVIGPLGYKKIDVGSNE